MESIPEEVVQAEILLKLDPKDLSEYCAASRRYATICRRKWFWKKKVANASRQQLQKWLLDLAKLGETVLFELLYNEINNISPILIDTRVIAYCAMYLLEQEKYLSVEGKRLLAYLIYQHRTSTPGINPQESPLRKYYENIVRDTEVFRQKLLNGKIVGIQLSYSYLNDYAREYIYKETKDILPSVETYVERILVLTDSDLEYVGIEDIIILLVGKLLEYNDIERISNIIEYIEENISTKEDFPKIYYLIKSDILTEGTYEQATELMPEKQEWGSSFPPIVPVDERVYNDLVVFSEYAPNIMERAYRCFEPQEWLLYLNTLVKYDKITKNEKINIMKKGARDASYSLYSYFSRIINDELKL